MEMQYALEKGGKCREVEDHGEYTVVYKRFALVQDEKKKMNLQAETLSTQ